MRAVRYLDSNQARWGLLRDDQFIQPLTSAPYLDGQPCGQAVLIQDVKLLAPCEPTKIVAIGKNYHDHIKELDSSSQVPQSPILFIMPPTSVNHPGSPIRLLPTSISKRIDYEGELALVIGKPASRITPEQAPEYIAGYTCLNDVTARDIQQADGQWSRAKSADGFAPIGPVLTDEVDPQNLQIQTRLNGKVVQQSSTSQQIWPVTELVSLISQTITLLPGDVVTTGTPSGIGPMKAGDVVEVCIEGIGCLQNPVEAE